MGQYDTLQSAAPFAQVIGKLIEMIRFCCSGWLVLRLAVQCIPLAQGRSRTILQCWVHC